MTSEGRGTSPDEQDYENQWLDDAHAEPVEGRVLSCGPCRVNDHTGCAGCSCAYCADLRDEGQVLPCCTHVEVCTKDACGQHSWDCKTGRTLPSEECKHPDHDLGGSTCRTGCTSGRGSS